MGAVQDVHHGILLRGLHRDPLLYSHSDHVKALLFNNAYPQTTLAQDKHPAVTLTACNEETSLAFRALVSSGLPRFDSTRVRESISCSVSLSDADESTHKRTADG